MLNLILDGSPEHLLLENQKMVPMTVLTPVTPWKRFFLRPMLWWFRRDQLVDVDRLNFIHFARWAVIDREMLARGTRKERLRRSYFLFSTNYNGPWDQYIDSFALIKKVRRGMNFLWFASDKFPWAYPIRRFKRYIRYHEYPVDAYYTAYPDATIRDINASLALVSLITQMVAAYETGGTWRPPVNFPLAALIRRSSIADPSEPAPSEVDVQELVHQFALAAAPLVRGSRGKRTPPRGGTGGPAGLQL